MGTSTAREDMGRSIVREDVDRSIVRKPEGSLVFPHSFFPLKKKGTKRI